MEHNISVEEIAGTETFRKNAEIILFARRRASLAKYRQRKAAGMKPIGDPVDLLANWSVETLVRVYRDDLARRVKAPLAIRRVVREICDAAANKTLQDYVKRASGTQTENK